MSDPDGQGPGDAQPKGEPEDHRELDIDSAFAAIVAEFSIPTPLGRGPWPASEDLDDDLGRLGDLRQDPGDPPGEPPDGATDPAVPPGASGSTPAERRDAVRRRIVLPGEGTRPIGPGGPGDRNAQQDDEDEGYVPPEPPPLPRGDLVSRVAWSAVIGGPLFLLIAALSWRTLPSMLLLIALLAFVGGFVTLVARMPQEHPDDPDDGAVV